MEVFAYVYGNHTNEQSHIYEKQFGVWRVLLQDLGDSIDPSRVHSFKYRVINFIFVTPSIRVNYFFQSKSCISVKVIRQRNKIEVVPFF